MAPQFDCARHFSCAAKTYSTTTEQVHMIETLARFIEWERTTGGDIGAIRAVLLLAYASSLLGGQFS